MSREIEQNLTQEYKREAWEFNKTFPSQKTILFIRRICSHPTIPKHYPFLKLLTGICKDLLINEIELALLAIIIEEVLILQHEDILSKDLICAAFAAKSYLNDDMEVLANWLEQKFSGFRDCYNSWISMHPIEVAISTLNEKYLKLSVQPSCNESLIDYNFYVDEVLELTPVICMDTLSDVSLPEPIQLDTVFESIRHYR